jgi:hypothetical protein
MRNKAEFAWIVLAIAATAFATFMAMFGVVAFIYWLLGFLGLAG